MNKWCMLVCLCFMSLSYANPSNTDSLKIQNLENGGLICSIDFSIPISVNGVEFTMDIYQNGKVVRVIRFETSYFEKLNDGTARCSIQIMPNRNEYLNVKFSANLGKKSQSKDISLGTLQFPFEKQLNFVAFDTQPDQTGTKPLFYAIKGIDKKRATSIVDVLKNYPNQDIIVVYATFKK